MMRHFLQVAAGIEVLPLVAELHRQPELWNQHRERTNGAGSFTDTDDIWVRFRAFADLTTPGSYAESFPLVMYPAWFSLAHLRPIVFGLMARLEAVHLGGILLTRVPPGKQVAPHDDRGRWHAEHFTTKVYVPLATNPDCYNTCADETVIMQKGDAWVFDNLKVHSTVNQGTSDRVTLIVSLRCE